MPWNKPSKCNTKNSGSSVDKTLNFVVEEAHYVLPAAHKCGHLIAVYLPPVSACRNSLIPVRNDSVGRWHSVLCELLCPSTMSIKNSTTSSTNTIAKKCRRLGEIRCTTLILLLAQQMRMTQTGTQLKGCSKCVSSNQLLHHNVQGEGEALDLVTCLNPLPVQFKALLHGLKGCVFFSGHLNLRTTPETGLPSREKNHNN